MLEIAAFTGALSSLGALIKIANESKNVPMIDKLIDLQQKIITIQGDFGEMQHKFFELQQQNRELTESVATKTRYEQRLNVLWRKDDGGKYIGPYCPICKASGKEIPLRPTPGYDTSKEWFYMSCPVFHLEGGNERMPKPVTYAVPKSEIPEGWLFQAT